MGWSLMVSETAHFSWLHFRPSESWSSQWKWTRSPIPPESIVLATVLTSQQNQEYYSTFTCSSASFPLSFFILSAVCHVRQMTSPTRPMAWNSKELVINSAKEEWLNGFKVLYLVSFSDLWIRRYDAYGSHIMKNVLCSNCFCPDTGLSKSYILLQIARQKIMWNIDCE